VTRFVDRGAIVAAYVGIGMAMVIAVSFLLVIPIEPAYWLLAPLSGLLIGYYADARADRRTGPWSRIVVNGLYAGLVTGLSLAILLLGVKALFFAADNGFRDPGLGGPLTCQTGAGCVFARYQAQDAAGLTAAGITDVGAFTSFYWGQQLSTAGTLVGVTLAGALGGALAFGVTRIQRPAKGSPRSTSEA
jgi:hypothetical protein